MPNTKFGIYEAVVIRVLGPDLFEADLDMGLGIHCRKKLKLGGVDSEFVRNMTEEQRKSAVEFLRYRVEGKIVSLRVIQRGDLSYAKMRYGQEQQDIADEMFQNGTLRKFVRPKPEDRVSE